MEIRKTQVFVPGVAPSLRRDPVGRASARDGAEAPEYSPSSERRVGDDDGAAVEETHAALMQRLKSSVRVGPGAERLLRDPGTLGHHARRALDAYRVQLNEPPDDARATLSRMLGVDYYV
jgi:hypothetical protein